MITVSGPFASRDDLKWPDSLIFEAERCTSSSDAAALAEAMAARRRGIRG